MPIAASLRPEPQAIFNVLGIGALSGPALTAFLMPEEAAAAQWEGIDIIAQGFREGLRQSMSNAANARTDDVQMTLGQAGADLQNAEHYHPHPFWGLQAPLSDAANVRAEDTHVHTSRGRAHLTS
jgi:hypothetical protein